MKEKIKSVLLFLLIVTSLWQSYLLAYSQPKFSPIHFATYVENELQGSKKEESAFFFPTSLVLHFGENKQTVLNPDHAFYEKIFYDKISKRKFESFQLVSLEAEALLALQRSSRGVEIKFEQLVPVPILQNMMQLENNYTLQSEKIKSIWIGSNEGNDEVNVYFFAASNNVYQSINADFLLDDIEQYLTFGQYLNEQVNYTSVDTIHGAFYLPEKEIPSAEITMSVNEYTAESFINSLFVDPSTSRSFPQTDGSQIYTDGKRGLQIDENGNWMSFTNPVAPTQQSSTAYANLATAIKFVNQHGGWNGTYRLYRFPEQTEEMFRFVSYYNTLPIIQTEESIFGLVQVQMEENVVTSYERSMLEWDEEISRSKYMLSGGEELTALINDYSEPIVTVFPAYEVVRETENVTFIPRWAVEKEDGTFDFIE
ncbi:YycH family regulatory protein [Longirhabdus pacifica]|uniref:YycH family regulatory protein n=1 Tax=Longirhabdus pacifica TaxID=2305227 RepID=UPI001008858C|nr:two-component system activity regulator YycH [Longirhabdus pacifica]